MWTYLRSPGGGTAIRQLVIPNKHSWTLSWFCETSYCAHANPTPACPHQRWVKCWWIERRLICSDEKCPTPVNDRILESVLTWESLFSLENLRDRKRAIGNARTTINSPSGNWTPVSRVTGGDTNHYTNEEAAPTRAHWVYVRIVHLLPTNDWTVPRCVILVTFVADERLNCAEMCYFSWLRSTISWSKWQLYPIDWVL